MINCPFCNQPMVGIDSEGEDSFGDLFRCGACQVEQAIHWEKGERLLAWQEDPEE